MDLDLLTHRRRESDAIQEPHDPDTCPTCRQRRLDERELIRGYGLRTCPECQGLTMPGPRCDDCGSKIPGGIL